MELKFTVHGEPKGKGRPRFNTKTGHAITPKDTVIYENLVRMEYLNQCGETKFPDDAMLDMRIKAYYTIPPSRPKKKKELMRAGIIRPTKKPDMDNCIKIIADALNKIACLAIQVLYTTKSRKEARTELSLPMEKWL